MNSLSQETHNSMKHEDADRQNPAAAAYGAVAGAALSTVAQQLLLPNALAAFSFSTTGTSKATVELVRESDDLRGELAHKVAVTEIAPVVSSDPLANANFSPESYLLNQRVAEVEERLNEVPQYTTAA